MNGQANVNVVTNASHAEGLSAAAGIAPPFLNVAALYALEVRRHYKRHRYAIVPDAISRTMCRALLDSLRSSKFIVVDIKEAFEVSRFYTKNGDELATTCPQLVKIQHCFLEWIKNLAGEQYVPLDNRSIGFSLNVTPPGGGLGTHHDRNESTVILYLNDVDGGGELYVYPKFPKLFGYAVHRYAIKFLNSLKNPIARMVHVLLFRPVRVIPRAGTVVALTKLSEHRVEPVHPGSVRFSFVVGFDRPGVSFNDVQDFYGYGKESVTLDDALARSKVVGIGLHPVPKTPS